MTTTMKPKPAGTYWSDDQWRAIALSGGDMLVAAAAGSGKTAVLVERIIRKLMDREQPLSVDRLLVATFTKAAAAEMRGRITEALEKELAKDSNNEYLNRQLAMLGRASITTLHSFCMEVIQRYYTLIPLDPGFRIASESETALLRQEVLEELLEEKYGSEPVDSPFVKLVDRFGGERSDAAVFTLIQRLYDFSRSHPWPDHWLQEASSAFLAPDLNALEKSAWVQSLLADTALALGGAMSLLSQAKALALSPGGPEPYAVTLEEDLNVVQSLHEAVAGGAWASLYDVFQGASFGKLKPVKKDQTDPDIQERVKALREDAKKTLADLRSQLYGRPAEAFLREMHDMAPLLGALSGLVSEFGERYRLHKVSKGWLDFSDLEHYCLRILRHPDSEPGELRPSDAALEYRQQFDEVLLDEYQDTNTVQETIVRLIARENPGNRFMVGDVKQSIYRFRLAEPGLFLEKYRTYGDDFDGAGMRIDLARNFRSRREVVDAVNLLFRQIMNESVAEISYDPRAELVYGEGFPLEAIEDYRPELLLIDRDAGSGGSSESSDRGDGETTQGEGGEEEDEAALIEAVRLEARAIAARIRGMLGESGEPLRIYDKQLQAMRPVTFRDMVILLRSTLTWAPAMIEELRVEGIPAYGELSQGYFQASEVETMLSLLQVIDNPLQDIPLAAVLRSPLYDFSEEELADIRLASPGGRYYEAVLARAADGNAEMSPEGGDNQMNDSGGESITPVAGLERDVLSLKLLAFLRQLEVWRGMARVGQLGDLIREIYRETGYLEWVGGLPGGTQRQSNLQALLDRAKQYEVSSSAPGLFRFLRYVNRLRENGGDLGAPGDGGEQGDGVRMMTIHKSKGLEFPVVFVAGLSKQFNRQDLNAPFLMHKEMGFGPKYVDADTRVSYPTLPNLAIRRRAQMELLAEEMRVLYVALTRPKDKLVLVSSVKNLTKSVEIWGGALEADGEQLPDYLLARGRCYLDWIGPALIRHPSARELRQFAGLPETGSTLLADSPSEWDVAFISARAAGQTGGAEAAATAEHAADPAQIKALLQGGPVAVLPGAVDDSEAAAVKEAVATRLSWTYPYAAASRIAAKTSVTEMKALLAMQEEPARDVFAEAELAHEREQAEAAEQPEFKLHLRRPRFMEQRKLTPTERGVAYHTLMQHLPFDAEPGIGVVQATLTGLVERQIMTTEQAAAIDAENIARLLLSPLGELLRQADWVKREMPFSYGLPAAEASPQLGGLEAADEALAGAFAGEAIRELDGEIVLIQGIVDCLFAVDGKVYLLDYKSDRVLEHRGGTAALAESYRFQLELYAKAVEEITGAAVDEKWLYFFDGGQAVKL
ncbi:helicase-exonuclease AddAB subunit AddA [Paenibacillus sp. DXFW5]|uniref:ATP-dependent helicase/nuclease subunit A n=1 Tax=Paenibacillus rhizolycopersici TaxID=2780073 RepID=A0ABS2H0Q4_9BACL|nr:helicase-exonuclease AddAB subunit AddA [Paenibacillus rhizolycopersici]MBM6994915.1 helicase-exonuclease AddAB subunit AddA [Paenibacillus rhizolycopersici]